MASLIDLFKGSSYDEVKTDTETFIEQETTGLRIMSAAELNNPLLYGSDSIRIATKSTPSLNTMKEDTQGELSSGGLLGKGLSVLSGGKLESLNDVRNGINDFLGIPSPLIPTRVAEQVKDGTPVNEVIDKNGTEFGKFLQQTGGGSLQNIGRNALGNAISIAKDKATKLLLGTPGEIGVNGGNEQAPKFEGTLDPEETYTDLQQGLNYKEEKSPDALANDTLTKFPKSGDLRKFSPAFGARSSNSTPDTALDSNESTYLPDEAYTDISNLNDKSLENRYGLTNESDSINSTGLNDSYVSDEIEKYDLIPFWISKIGELKRTHFRTLISGLNETVTPSWNSSKFFGNPYSYHTYGGVERSVTFNLFIYCMNPTELGKNWEKINKLTQYTYPSINQDSGLVNPPIIEFRIGNIYKEKVGFIESLSYTFPDNGTWETDLDGFQLPKFIDVSISIKFIEQAGSEKNLYSYQKSSAAQSELNADNDFSTNSNDSGISTTVNKFGDTVTRLNIPTQPIKNGNTGLNVTPPSESELGIPSKGSESGIGDVPADDLARVYRIPNAEAKRELKFLGKGQSNTRLV